MKTPIKLLSILPIIALSSCSVYQSLSNGEAITKAKEILTKQNSGAITFKGFTYKGNVFSKYVGENDETLSYQTVLVRDYENPYLHFKSVVKEENQTFLNEIYIYKTEGNIIYAVNDSLLNIKEYTAYPLTLENTFANLVSTSSNQTNIDYVERLIYSQETLNEIENFYTKPTPREIYQGFTFLAKSKGEGSLSVSANYGYVDDEESVSVSEEFYMNNYLFASSSYINTIAYLNDNGDFKDVIIRENESIVYKTNLIYPNLNDYTFIDNN